MPTIEHNLPAEHVPPIGREREVMAARAFLLDSVTPLLTVIGPGGIGKTTLALHLAHNILNRFPHGVHIVDLTPLSRPDLIPGQIARAVGIEELPGRRPEDAIIDHYRDHRALLLLDNFEHLLEGAGFISSLLRTCPNLKTLVTSREALRLREEQVFPLLPLALPKNGAVVNLAVLARVPAVRLFIERARAVRPGFALTKENASSVAAIVARLDGLPLAIELAAARVRLFPPKVLLERLEVSPLGLLTGDRRDAPARQRTVRATIAWSYDLLEPADRRLFRRLGVFADGFTLEAVESVAAAFQDIAIDVLTGLESLLDKSLIVRLPVEEESRFGLLDTLRAFALDQLAENGELDHARRAHLDYYLALVEEATTHGDVPMVARLVAEEDNLRAALAWSLSVAAGSPERAAVAVRLAGALDRFWQFRTHPLEAGRWLAQALAYCAPPPTNVAPGDRERVAFEARLHNAAGSAAWLLGDFTASIAHHGDALACYRALGDAPRVADALLKLSAPYSRLADSEQAIAALNESLAISHAAGDWRRAARVLNNLGVIEEDLGLDAAAEQHYRESLALARKEGDVVFLAMVLNNVALIELRAGRLDEAQRLLDESVAMAHTTGSSHQIASCLLALGEIARRRGDLAVSRGLYREVLRVSRENELRYYFTAGLHALAVLELDAGQAKKATTLAGAVAALRERFGIRQLEAYSPRGLECDLEVIHGALSEATYRAAWEAGRRLNRDQALALAMQEPTTDHRPQTTDSSQTVVRGLWSVDSLTKLTPREREVALLMAAGRTNEDIAAELFITIKTVEKHAGNALGKLGFHSRVELAAWAAANGYLG